MPGQAQDSVGARFIQERGDRGDRGGMGGLSLPGQISSKSVRFWTAFSTTLTLIPTLLLTPFKWAVPL